MISITKQTMIVKALVQARFLSLFKLESDVIFDDNLPRRHAVGAQTISRSDPRPPVPAIKDKQTLEFFTKICYNTLIIATDHPPRNFPPRPPASHDGTRSV